MAEDYVEDVDGADSLEDAPEDMLEEDEIEDREEGFMKGYNDVEDKDKSDDVKEEEASPEDV